MSTTYRVVISGLSPSSDPVAVRTSLSKMFKATPEQIESILSQREYVVKNGLTLVVAEKYQIALRNAGALVKIEADQTETESLDADLPVVQRPESTKSSLNGSAGSGAAYKAGNQIGKLLNSTNERGVESTDSQMPNRKKKNGWFFETLSSIAALLVVIGAYNVFSGKIPNPLESVLQSSTKELYKFWQVSNPPNPGVYADELLDGELLYKCDAEGKYPAKFGVLRIKTTFDQVALKNAEPFLVYVGGIDYGTKLVAFGAQPPETGGAGIIGRLRLAGCTIPPDLQDRAIASVTSKLVVPKEPMSAAANGIGRSGNDRSLASDGTTPGVASQQSPDVGQGSTLDMAGVWNCAGDEIARFADGTFLVNYAPDPSTQTLIYGRYKLVGRMYSQTATANMFVKHPYTNLLPRGWTAAVKADTVGESNYTTAIYEVLSTSAGVQELNFLRLVNWDGKDQQQILTRITCYAVPHPSLDFESVKLQVPLHLAMK